MQLKNKFNYAKSTLHSTKKGSIAAVVLQQFAKIASEFRPNVTTMTAATSSTTAAAASAT